MAERFNRRSIEVITSADSPVVSLAVMKAELREDDPDQDSVIEGYIEAATESVKQYLGVALRTETLELTLDGFGHADSDWDLRLGPGMHDGHRGFIQGGMDAIDLPFGPIASVTSIKTYDRDNTESTLAAGAYFLDARGWRVALNEGYSWPSDLRDTAAVKVRYVTGYGAASVPAPIVLAIKEAVRSIYDGCARGTLPEGAQAMLSPYKRLDRLAW